MRLIALLSWFNESPTWLAATVASLKGVCDTVVAVDGRYDLFPSEQDVSGPEQHDAIRETAHACGMSSAIYAPLGPWEGGEMEKRTYMFDLGWFCRDELADMDEWFLIIDADERVTAVPDGLADRLMGYARADVTLWWHNDPSQIGPLALEHNIEQYGATLAPRLFRAEKGLHYDGWHGNVVTTDDSATELRDFKIEHRHAHRDQWRRRQQADYIIERQRAGAETLPT